MKSNNLKMNSKPRVRVLDTLRGLAALCVALFCHYRHFSYPLSVKVIPSSPFFNFQPFHWLYVDGWLLVDFFFVLSGFIFSAFYLEKIRESKVTKKEFFILRFSRLYPLHFVTMLMAAAFFWIYYLVTPNFHSPYNYDPFHFLLNIFMLQKGYVDSNFSFNAPSWSIAVEVFSYVIFFILASRSKHFVLSSIAVIFVVLVILQQNLSYPILNVYMARGLLGFFSGCLLQYLITSPYKKITIAILATLFSYVVLTLILTGNYSWVFQRQIPIFSMIIFPFSIVMALECSWLRKVLELKQLTFLGDISYSIYLLQLPLQFIFQIYSSCTHTPLPADSVYFFCFYAVVLVGCGYLSYRYFEIPMQNYLRRHYLSTKYVIKTVQHNKNNNKSALA